MIFGSICVLAQDRCLPNSSNFGCHFFVISDLIGRDLRNEKAFQTDCKLGINQINGGFQNFIFRMDAILEDGFLEGLPEHFHDHELCRRSGRRINTVINELNVTPNLLEGLE